MNRIARWVANFLGTSIWIGVVAESDPIQDWPAELPRLRTVAEAVLAAQTARPSPPPGRKPPQSASPPAPPARRISGT